MYSSVVLVTSPPGPMWTREVVLAATNPNSAVAVIAVIRPMVFFAPQNPYSHAMGKFSGNPIRAESRSTLNESTSFRPSFWRFEGIHWVNPNWTIPMPMPRSRTTTERPMNGPEKSWAHRALTFFSTSRSDAVSSTTTAP